MCVSPFLFLSGVHCHQRLRTSIVLTVCSKTGLKKKKNVFSPSFVFLSLLCVFQVSLTLYFLSSASRQCLLIMFVYCRQNLCISIEAGKCKNWHVWDASDSKCLAFSLYDVKYNFILGTWCSHIHICGWMFRVGFWFIYKSSSQPAVTYIFKYRWERYWTQIASGVVTLCHQYEKVLKLLVKQDQGKVACTTSVWMICDLCL